jgi:DNA-binding beta-propeller fold protein YncE
MKKIIFLMLGLSLFSDLVIAQSGKNYSIIRKLKIHSSGGWDYISVDESHQKIYVSHGNQVNILDLNSGDSVGYVPNTNGVHGIAFVPEKNEGYISAGRLNSVITFDLTTYQVKDSIKVGKNPDAIFYDASQKKIITCNGASQDASFIDVGTDKVVFTLPLGGKPETAVSDEKGLVFINIEDKNEVVKVDGIHYKILEHFPLVGGEEPTGLSIDPKTHRLFVSSGNKMIYILNSQNGKEITKIATGSGTDGNGFDPGTHLIFSSNGEGTLTIIKELSANKFELIKNLTTEVGGRTMCISTTNHHVYIPTADYLPKVAGQRYPRTVPGSFRILDIGE